MIVFLVEYNPLPGSWITQVFVSMEVVVGSSMAGLTFWHEIPEESLV